jgi:quinol monooxygenase YgiN
MTCTVLLELRVKEEHVEEVAASFKDALPDTRTFDGCIDVYMVRDMDNPNTFIAVETWESREKYETYFAWRTERGDIDNALATMEGDLKIRFFDRIGA